ncbi:MAG: TonB-dependent receptor [Bacteroidaceae bacterium]|nr:TonB-dependent receptor [Bacteroidaceae bacterium]
MSIKTVLSGVIAPAKLVCAKGMNKTSEFSFSALAGSVSFRLFKFACLFVLLFAWTEASAQNTTATISGSVKDSEGEPLQAAAVLVTNNETGAFYGTVTNRFGIYSLSGLKPGNYLVKISFLGYQEVAYDNVILSLGKDYNFNTVLNEDNVNIPTITIRGESTHFNETRTGQIYNVNRESMSMLPSVNRSMLDYTRLSPYSGIENTMAGRDGRVTTLTIDGAVMNNSFGLSADLPGAGTPISIDAVEEMQIAIAPYDVRQSNFTGGGINVITKSGTNTFKGTAYTYFHNEKLRGNKIDGIDLGNRVSSSHTTVGFTMGGPILKDKLFYFVNAEYVTTPSPITEYKLSEDGVGDAAGKISRVTAADMEQFATALKAYGYDAGSYDLSNGDQTNTKMLARIDWNINNNHNLMLRYNWTGNKQWFTPSGKSTVGATTENDRVSKSGYVFRNNCYTQNDNAWSAVAELNSRLSGRMSNKFSASISDVSNLRGTESADFPHIDILKDDDAFMSAGCEAFTKGTGNYVRTYNISDHIRWTLAHSTITAGLSYQYQKGATNYRMFGTGYYRYNSLEDFINQAVPAAFGMTYTYDGIDDPASRTSFGQTAAFLQAESHITDNLTVTYGLRADHMQYYEPLTTNESFKALDWTNHFYAPGQVPAGYQAPVIDNGRWPKANVQFSPRVGFNWDVDDAHTLTVHGGAGLFTGRIPLVFFATIPNSSGMLQGTVMSSDPTNAMQQGLQNNFLYTEEALRNYLIQQGLSMTANPNPTLNNTTITGIAGDFKLPQVFKTSLAVDYEPDGLAFPLAVSVEGIYNKDINAVYVENYNQICDDAAPRFNGADNRVNYKGIAAVQPTVSKSGGAMVISNTDKGYSWSLGGTLKAEPIYGLKTELSYIHQVSMSVQDMKGSQLNSAWRNDVNVNSPNEQVLRPSAYVIPDKLTAMATYRLGYSKNKFMSTEIGLFYTGYTAGTYSYVYTTDMNGDGINNDLIYIPATKDELKFVDNGTFTAEAQQQAFWNFVNQDKYLSKHKGEYADANAARMPWLNRFDLHLAQNFNVGALRGSKRNNETLQLSLDIMNVGNLINSSWGVMRTPSACNNAKILEYKGADADGYPQFTMATNKEGLVSKTFDMDKSNSNCWYLQLGVKLIFD